MKLYRSRKNVLLFGLCGGIAEAANLDAGMVRILTVIGGLLTGGLPMLFVYIVLSMIIPKEAALLPLYNFSTHMEIIERYNRVK